MPQGKVASTSDEAGKTQLRRVVNASQLDIEGVVKVSEQDIW